MAYKEGDTLHNPETNEWIVLQNNKWVPTKPPAASASVAPAEPTVGYGEDVAKSIVPSLVRGTTALATTPGSMTDLAAKGVGAAGEYMGAGEGFSDAIQEGMKSVVGAKVKIPGTNIHVPVLPSILSETYPGAMEKLEKLKGSKFYEAQTTPGKYASTVLETLPSALAGPGGILKKLGVGVAAGLGAEGAGQATEGSWYEPIARALGGIGGAVSPTVARKAITTSPVTDPLRQAQNKILADKGVTLTAAEKTGGAIPTWLEANLEKYKPARLSPEAQSEQYTKAAMAATGSSEPLAVRPVGRGGATANTIAEQKQTLSNEMDALKEIPAITTYDTVMQGQLKRAVDEFNHAKGRRFDPKAKAHTPESPVDDIMKRIRGTDTKTMKTDGMSGTRYADVRDELTGYIDELTGKDNTTAKALIKIRNALEGAVERTGPAEWRDNAVKWSNIKAMEKAADAKGIVDPSIVLKKHINPNSELADLSRAMVARAIPVKAAPDKAGLLSRALSGALGYAAGHYGGGGPAGGLAGAALGASGTYGPILDALIGRPAAKAVFSKWGQGILGNQVLPPQSLDPNLVARSLLASPTGQTMLSNQ